MSGKKDMAASLKAEAEKHMAKGRWEKALDGYLCVVKLVPDDVRSLFKAGDCARKMNRKADALNYYDKAAKLYEAEGFVVKAIAVNKLMLDLEPELDHVQERLSKLYEARIKDAPVSGKLGVSSGGGASEPYPRSELFSGLSHDEFMAVVKKMEPIEVPPDTLILSEGDPGDSLYIIASGEVKIYREDHAGGEIWIANLGEGEFFGEFGFFSGAKRSASVRSQEETTLLELSKERMNSIISERPRVKEVLFRFYKSRILDSLLAISPIFSSLPREKRRFLVEAFTYTEQKAGAVIVSEGDVGDRMYFLQSGQVQVYTEKEGERIHLAGLAEGDFFGEVSVIAGKPRTATVAAITDVQLAEIVRDSLMDIIEGHPEIIEAINRFIQMRVENTISAIMEYKNRKSESGLI
ncbi:MAG: cyclic nucleotide-binding domain-containing protein [Deltaproteobacteria bacterium]|nr:cyclic nucleotide-binding domain-containing protein [Candidatus Zymogenaceae bacterium]